MQADLSNVSVGRCTKEPETGSWRWVCSIVIGECVNSFEFGIGVRELFEFYKLEYFFEG